MKIYRNVWFSQWRGCLFIQVGTFGLVFLALPGNRSWGMELVTPERWFALRPFKRLTWWRRSS